MIEVHDLSRRYGSKQAVDHIDFAVKPGIITGFVGPNGSGKTTTMRMIVGLERPDSGTVAVNGKNFIDQPAPLREVGALLDIRSAHPGATARQHLSGLALTHGIGKQRVDSLFEEVGLADAASKRVGKYSLGMKQRLGIAAALLADPQTLILDEPLNGLDPQGIRWVRNLLVDQARQGKTVFLSSHLINEMALTADQLLVVGSGRIIADVSVEETLRNARGGRITVETPNAAALAELLTQQFGCSTEFTARHQLTVTGASVEQIGDAALEARLPIYGMNVQEVSLEDAFFTMTDQFVEYSSPADRTIAHA